MKRLWLVLLAVCALVGGRAGAQPRLPVYFEDSHAGSFYWLAARLPLDEPHVLLHFDAHSDASGIFDSDAIRRRLRQVSSEEEREAVLGRMREKVVVECFNWIEPLMPRPFQRVIWVPAVPLAGKEAMVRMSEAREALEGHTEIAPRAAGEVSASYEVRELPALTPKLLGDAPVVASIDLDFFAGMSPRTRTLQFRRMLDFVLELPRLRAVTFAVSRPYLRSEAEAHALVEMALAAMLEVGNADIEFAPFREARDPHSQMAERLAKAGRPVPRYEIDDAPASLRHLLLANAERVRVTHEPERWAALLESWRGHTPLWWVELIDRQPSTNGDWNLDAAERAVARVRVSGDPVVPARVRWFALEASTPSFNVVGDRPGGANFAENAPCAVRAVRRLVAETVGAEPLSWEKLRACFDAKTGMGTLVLCGEVTAGADVLTSAPVRIVRGEGTGFRRALLEQFHRPYIYGSSELRVGTLSGPETGLGADCANFLVAAFRRNGRVLPWSDPGKLRNAMEQVAAKAALGAVKIDDAQIERGLVVHLGTHVAAVMRDEPPLGILSANDLVAHQLEGPPEMVPLGQFLAARKRTHFDVLQPRTELPGARMVFGGDVMLGRKVGEGIMAGVDPLAEIAPLFREADLVWVNLECVIAEKGQVDGGKPVTLRAPAMAAEALRRAGVTAVGLGNNHAADFGAEGLREMQARLRASGILMAGANAEPREKWKATLFETWKGVDDPRRVRVALLPFLCEPGSALVANAEDRAALAAEIAAARKDADCVVALPHWGDENQVMVNEDQRSLARWLIDRGVDLVEGAGPHCRQAADVYRGKRIFYSLGNLVFDGPGPSDEWGRGDLVTVELARDGRILGATLIPCRTDDRGVVRRVTPQANLESRSPLAPVTP